MILVKLTIDLTNTPVLGKIGTNVFMSKISRCSGWGKLPATQDVGADDDVGSAAPVVIIVSGMGELLAWSFSVQTMDIWLSTMEILIHMSPYNL